MAAVAISSAHAPLLTFDVFKIIRTERSLVMDVFLERIYLEQVIEDCQMCIQSAQNLNHELSHSREPFSCVIDLIHKAASLSRMFWPPKSFNKESTKRADSRGMHLRKSIGINENHVIKSRSIRDHLEHFDERLDDWAENSTHQNIIKKLIGSRSAVGGDIGNDDIIHHFDPQTLHYYFRGQGFNIKDIVIGIEDIQNRAIARINVIK